MTSDEKKAFKRAKKLLKDTKRALKEKRGRLEKELKQRIEREETALSEALDKKEAKRLEKAAEKLEATYQQFLAKPKKSTFREYAEAIVIAVILALFVRTFVVQAFKIPSGSMEPTLLVGDHILVSKFIYGVKIPFTHIKLFSLSQPKIGDVIVFIYPVDPSKDFIKRVIAVEGDTVRVAGKTVYVNDSPLKENYTIYEEGSAEPRENFGPVKVPKGSVFVLGDNRDKSYDSRFWGFVKKEAIKGRAFIIYVSWDSDNFGIRWKRLGNLIR